MQCFYLPFLPLSPFQLKILWAYSNPMATWVRVLSPALQPIFRNRAVCNFRAGYNVWGDHDEFQYVWKKMKGDFILYTRAEFLGTWVNYHRKVGWMVRKSLDGNSAHVNAVEHGDGLTSLQFRRSAGAQTEEHKMKITHANILQLERKGSIYIMRAAIYGEPYQTDTITGLDLGDELYVGLLLAPTTLMCLKPECSVT